jgi:uncharacterized protein (DUF1697 family)
VKYIAFLRAINVGGHTVKMERLRELFEELGLSAVETFIASGNVIFETSARSSAALEKKIEAHLRQSLGYEVATFLRSAAELAAVAAHEPFPRAELDASGNSLYIAFTGAPPDDEARQKLVGFDSATDAFHVHGREVYWLCRTRFSDSPITGAKLERALKMPATARNVTTVRKLAANYCA